MRLPRIMGRSKNGGTSNVAEAAQAVKDGGAKDAQAAKKGKEGSNDKDGKARPASAERSERPGSAGSRGAGGGDVSAASVSTSGAVATTDSADKKQPKKGFLPSLAKLKGGQGAKSAGPPETVTVAGAVAGAGSDSSVDPVAAAKPEVE